MQVVLDHQLSYDTWKLFVEKGIMAEDVRPFVAASWHRCRRLGLDPFSRNTVKVKDIELLRKKNAKLLESSLPVMDLLQELTKGSGFIVVLTDQHGWVLEVVGDDEVIQIAESNNNLRTWAARAEETA
jgi:transcriptional regulator of acetoin/glycerol metabolism